MSKSLKSVPSVSPAAAPSVTPSTMPASFKVSKGHYVSVPTIAERTRRAHDLLSLVQVAMIYRNLEHELDREDIVASVGYVPDSESAMAAAARLLSDAIEEVYWVSNHPEAAILDLRVPTESDWEAFQDEQATQTDQGGAR
jgi:hypothetical protein